MTFALNINDMAKLIRAFNKLSDSVQERLYDHFSSGSLEKALFPFQGSLKEGVIFTEGEHTYLVPIDSILQVHARRMDELDDDDDEGDSDDGETGETDLQETTFDEE